MYKFEPNITPKKMFELGIMGGSYFRQIKSPKTNKIYKNHNKKFKFLENIPLNKINNNIYDKNINKYKVKVGSSYEYWIEKKWINENYDPYGWIEWYSNYYIGRRTEDDLRQIKRWNNIAGKNGRFRKQLQNLINKNKSNDEKISPKIRQTLLHWGFDSSKMIVE
jgi:hypothetical protein